MLLSHKDLRNSAEQNLFWTWTWPGLARPRAR